MTSTIWFGGLAILLAGLAFYVLDRVFGSRTRSKRSGTLLLVLIILALVGWFFAPRLFPNSDQPKYDRWLNES